jgi:hypothetical protein
MNVKAKIGAILDRIRSLNVSAIAEDDLEWARKALRIAENALRRREQRLWDKTHPPEQPQKPSEESVAAAALLEGVIDFDWARIGVAAVQDRIAEHNRQFPEKRISAAWGEAPSMHLDVNSEGSQRGLLSYMEEYVEVRIFPREESDYCCHVHFDLRMETYKESFGAPDDWNVVGTRNKAKLSHTRCLATPWVWKDGGRFKCYGLTVSESAFFIRDIGERLEALIEARDQIGDMLLSWAEAREHRKR